MLLSAKAGLDPIIIKPGDRHAGNRTDLHDDEHLDLASSFLTSSWAWRGWRAASSSAGEASFPTRDKCHAARWRFPGVVDGGHGVVVDAGLWRGVGEAGAVAGRVADAHGAARVGDR